MSAPKPYVFKDYSKIGSVDNITGAFGLNIPVHTIKTPYADFPINITYHTNGVKLDAISNELGINWNLNIGGEINRIVNTVI